MILVTGSSGFLGTAVARALAGRGERVRLLGRSAPPADLAGKVDWFQGDLSAPRTLARCCAGCDGVVHTAARVGVWGAYQDFHDTNVGGTRALVEEARKAGVRRLVLTSTPSVVYNGQPLRGADETLPLTNARVCPAAYPVTKAIAEREVLAANGPSLRTLALRPHLIWGPGDRHLVPRVVARAREGRLRVVGDGTNRVDLVHIVNCVDAHLRALDVLAEDAMPAAAGRAFFITNGEPVTLWDFVNRLLALHGVPPVTKGIPLGAAYAVGAACEAVWRLTRRADEPPMTRFVAKELATDHWFSIDAAARLLGYRPRVSMEEGLAGLMRGVPAP